MRHLARLLDDLLDVSRITRGKVDLHREAVDLRAVVGEAVEAARPSLDRGRQRLSVTLGEPLFVHGDHTRLLQVVANLLDNAVKFTLPDGEIGVGAWPEGDVAVLVVRDTGIGMAAEAIPRIFDLFAQGESSLARSRGGLGIGLTLVRDIVQLHGGRVEAASAGLGLGSEFTVRLPMVAVSPQAPATDAPAARAPMRRILLIEDNRDAREMLRLTLELDGHDVRAVWAGAEGVEIALDWHPQLALVDIGLPGMSGYEVGRRLRDALGDEITLVALTGYGDADARQRSLASGFDHHLVKPVNPDALTRLSAHPRS